MAKPLTADTVSDDTPAAEHVRLRAPVVQHTRPRSATPRPDLADAWHPDGVNAEPSTGLDSPGYRRSVRTPRGEARREELLTRVTDDLATHGLVDFSLRRAARAAGTTHKVLLYHFDSVDDLLAQAMFRLRERRIDNALTAVRAADYPTLAERVRAIWPILAADETGLRVIDQAIGLVMYDPERYADLGRQTATQYLPGLLALCPDGWTDRRKFEVAEMIMAVMRGFLMDWRTTGEPARIEAGLQALARALDREEARPD